MNIRIVAVGNIKQSYYKEAIAEYTKRMSRYCNVEVIEVPECMFDGVPNAKQAQAVMDKEASSIMPKLSGCVVALDIQGKALSSTQLAQYMDDNMQSYSTFTFVIGGSYGLSGIVKAQCQLRLSFGNITLPHQLARVVLCEQLYRGITIQHNIPYHK